MSNPATPHTIPIKLQTFKKETKLNHNKLKRYLSKLAKTTPSPQFQKIVNQTNKQTWQQTNCLQCGNCCKTMTPTFTKQDIIRIAAHLKKDPLDIVFKHLKTDPTNNDMVNQTQPCQWLSPKTNICTIYEVRPTDCQQFPHHTKKPFQHYTHIYTQNIQYCPATYRFVQNLQQNLLNSTLTKP
jgi:Fe-S-cluster containining protein